MHEHIMSDFPASNTAWIFTSHLQASVQNVCLQWSYTATVRIAAQVHLLQTAITETIRSFIYIRAWRWLTNFILFGNKLKYWGHSLVEWIFCIYNIKCHVLTCEMLHTVLAIIYILGLILMPTCPCKPLQAWAEHDLWYMNHQSYCCIYAMSAKWEEARVYYFSTSVHALFHNGYAHW